MLKRIRARLLATGLSGAVLLLIVGGTATATGGFLATAVYGHRYIPQASAGTMSNCGAGKDCTYVSSVDDGLYFKNASGVVIPASSSPVASVSAAGYTNANVTVDAYGRITSITNGLAPAGGGYTTIQYNASNLTQRGPLNIFGSAITCKDNSGAARTDCTSGIINVNDYGAKCDGSTDSTTAFQSAATAATAGTQVIIPACAAGYVTTDTMTITHDNVHVIGAGPQATKWIFNPASAKAAFKVDNGGSIDRTYGGSISGIYFAGGNTTIQKIAIDLVDTSGYSVRNVWVDPSSSAAPPWRGANSIGIRARGREMTVIDNVRLWTDTPILVDVDPYISTPVSCDHFHLSNSYLFSTIGGGNSNLKINDNIIVTNFTIDGDNAWIVDKYGLFWQNAASTTVSLNVSISGVRCEQAVDSTGYSFFIDHTQGIYNLQMRDDMVAIAQNGMWIKGVTNATIEHGNFSATSGALQHLTVDRMKDLKVINTFWQIGPTVTLTGLTQIEGTPLTQTTQAMPSDGFWVDTSSTFTRAQRITGAIIAIANVFTNTSPTNTNNTRFDTTNAYTGGGTELFGFYNAGVRKFYIDANGALASKNGSYDTDGSIAMLLCAFNAASCTMGRTTTNNTFQGGEIHSGRHAVSDANYTTTTGDFIIAETTMTAGRTVTIQCTQAGREFIVKNESSGAFAITITPASGTCDGAASCATTAAAHAAAVRIYADGTNCNTF